MSIHRKACIAGIFEHPTRRADGIRTAQLHADVALGALADAGLSLQDVDGFFCGADAPDCVRCNRRWATGFARRACWSNWLTAAAGCAGTASLDLHAGVPDPFLCP